MFSFDMHGIVFGWFSMLIHICMCLYVVHKCIFRNVLCTNVRWQEEEKKRKAHACIFFCCPHTQRCTYVSDMHALFVHMHTQWQNHTTVALQMHKIPRGHRERTCMRVLVCMSGCLFGCVVHFWNASLAIFRMACENTWKICTQTLTYTFMFTGVQISHTHSDTHSSFTCLYDDSYIIEHIIQFEKKRVT